MTTDNLFMGKKYFADKNYEVAKSFLTKAAEEKNLEAYRLLGDLHCEIFYNVNESKYWYTKAALRGDSESQLKLGDFYPNDPETALFWYKKAYKANNKEVFIRLGNAYKTYQDFFSALYFYKEAAKTGDLRGYYEMSKIYKNVYNDKKSATKYQQKYIKK